MERWIADIVGTMHINKISNKDIAKEMGVTPEYISMLLNGKKSTKTAKEDLTSAIDSILAKRK